MTSAAEAREKLVERLDETLKRQEEVKETPWTMLEQNGNKLLEVFVLGNICICLDHISGQSDFLEENIQCINTYIACVLPAEQRIYFLGGQIWEEYLILAWLFQLCGTACLEKKRCTLLCVSKLLCAEFLSFLHGFLFNNLPTCEFLYMNIWNDQQSEESMLMSCTFYRVLAST